MRLGEILIRDRVITQAQLDEALALQKRRGGRLGTNLLDAGFTDEDAIARALGEQLGVPAAEQRHFDSINPLATAALAAPLAAKYVAVPFALSKIDEGKQLWVAMADPHLAGAAQEIAFVTGTRVMACVASETRIAS